MGNVPEEKSKRKEIRITIKNIGNGLASNLLLHRDVNRGSEALNMVIPVGENVYMYFVVNPDELETGLEFCLYYVDSMLNEYIQGYTVDKITG